MAEQKKEWELKSAKDVAGAVEWVRRRTKGRAMVVIAIGANSVAYSKDPRISPQDAANLLQSQLTAIRAGFERIHTAAQPTTHGTYTRGESEE